MFSELGDIPEPPRDKGDTVTFSEDNNENPSAFRTYSQVSTGHLNGYSYSIKHTS